MTIQEAIAARLAKIEEEAGRTSEVDRFFAPQRTADDRHIQAWIAAMREWIDNGIDGLTVNDSDVDGWRLEGGGLQGQGPSYKLIWYLPEGKIWTQCALGIDDLTPPVCGWWWNARHYKIGSDFSFPSLLDALTFAQTGKSLHPSQFGRGIYP